MARHRFAPAIGIAGELRVRSELMLRKLWPAVFDFDNGTDIVLYNGKRIGVKTASRPNLSKKDYSWRYSFSIRTLQVRNAGNGVYKKKYMKKDYIGLVDYWIFWCIEDKLFYIVPNGEVGQKLSIVIPTPEEKRKYKRRTVRIYKSKYDKYLNNWEQLR